MNWYKKASKTITIDHYRSIQNLVRKIISGNRQWTSEELELQQNYPEIIEELLIRAK